MLSLFNKANLESKLSDYKDNEIIVSAIWGDSEAYQFAKEIMDYLQKEGWNVDGFVDQVTFTVPKNGNVIIPMDNQRVQVHIGSNIN